MSSLVPDGSEGTEGTEGTQDRRFRVLVTGATGLVGSALLAVAFEFPQLELIPVGSADADLRSASQTSALFVRHLEAGGRWTA